MKAKVIACVLAAIPVICLALGCVRDQAARHYRLYLDAESLTVAKSTVLRDGMLKGKVEALLGRGEVLSHDTVTNLLGCDQLQTIHGTAFPKGVRDSDVFLGYPVLGGRRNTVLQFRENRLVNNVEKICLLADRDRSQDLDGKRLLVWLDTDNGLKLRSTPESVFVSQDGYARLIDGGRALPWVLLPQAFMAELTKRLEALGVPRLKATTYGRSVVDGGSWTLGIKWCDAYREVTVGWLNGWQADTQMLAEAACLTNIIGSLERQRDKMAEHPTERDSVPAAR